MLMYTYTSLPSVSSITVVSVLNVNRPFQRALLHFSGEWYLGTKLGMLIVMWQSLRRMLPNVEGI